MTITLLKNETPVLCLPNSLIFNTVLEELARSSKHVTYSKETFLKPSHSVMLIAGLEQETKANENKIKNERINIIII